MGLMQRVKGATFERAVAKILRARWPTATVRRSLQSEQAYESDIVVEGAAPMVAKRIWWECTTGRACNPVRKMAQAVRDIERLQARSRIPIVVWRRHGSPRLRVTLYLHELVCEVFDGPGAGYRGPLVEMDLDDFLALMPGWP